MFSVKLVARPDARMVEVPLEIEAALPRDFEGAALLASSGLPRRVRIKATKDSLKLSTAYRADQLLGDIVRTALRGAANDIIRVQDAVMKFIRAVRERRQDGATLLISSNGRGKIDVVEAGATARFAAAPPAPAPEVPPSPAPPDRLAALERRVADLEAAIRRTAQTADLADRVAQLEQRVPTAPIARAARPIADSADQGRDRSPTPARRATVIEAYADGLRMDLRARAAAAAAKARVEMERGDKAAALAADGELLGAPQDGTAQRLRDAAAQAAARQSGLTRLAEEIEFYDSGDLPVASQLLAKLEDSPSGDPAPVLEAIAQAVARSANPGDGDGRASWVRRAATLCAWQIVEPQPGESLDSAFEVLDSGGTSVAALVCPGLKRADGASIVRPRVLGVAKPPEAPVPAASPVTPEADLAPKPAIVTSSDAVASPTATIDALVPPAEPAAGLPVSEPPAPVLPPMERTTPFALLPAPNTPVLSLLDLSAETPIGPEEAAAAAAAAARVPRVVPDDAQIRDEALAAIGTEQAHYELDDSDVEEIHQLLYPLPTGSKPG
ncbi:MAG: hypothetical protein E6J66_15505 [Deltaproteobacteria bacterium]|nr:MAG: hypothetical protein E6J66_15505 [Deltaproteobacteria bacterium]